VTREAPRSLYFLIPLMTVLWSANFIVGKIALREFPPMLGGCLRITFAAAFICPLYVWRQWNMSWSNPDWLRLAVLGMFGVTLNQLFFIAGLSRTSAVHSVLMIAMTPVYVLIIAEFVKQERITFRKSAGMLIALGGVAILNVLPADAAAPGSGPTLLGDFLVFLGAVNFALFTVFGKNVTARYSSVTVNTICYLSGALALSPITLWQARDFPFARISPTAWTSLLYMAMFPSVVCYLIYYYALSYIPASRVAAFSYLQPVLATTMAVVALGERVTLPLVAGGAVIFSGVYLTERG
jgi:drug/metabolite transporter (DMT)-like permease